MSVLLATSRIDFCQEKREAEEIATTAAASTHGDSMDRNNHPDYHHQNDRSSSPYGGRGGGQRQPQFDVDPRFDQMRERMERDRESFFDAAPTRRWGSPGVDMGHAGRVRVSEIIAPLLVSVGKIA